MTPGGATLQTIEYDDCLGLLRAGVVGRLAFDVDEFPVILPVNYRLMETSGRVWIVVRARPGNVITEAPMHVAFQIDGIDRVERQGWSVLVRGTLHTVDPDAADFRARFDPEPWIEEERTAWLAVDPVSITGRRLSSVKSQWAFHEAAYL